MSGNHDPGGGPQHLGSPTTASSTNPNLSSMTPATGGDRNDSFPGRLRNFAEILSEEQHHRNILEVKIVRTSSTNDAGEVVKAKTLI